MFVKIRALDTLFFRTPRPFTAGEETWTDGIFPPYPRTIYGALRTYLILERGNGDINKGLEKFKAGEFKDELGTPDEPGNFTIKGPFLMKEDTIYFRTPLDTVIVDGKIKFLKFLEKPKIMVSNYKPERILLWQENKKPDNPKGWISYDAMIDYLKGKDNFEYMGDREFFLREEKIGITRNRDTFTAEEGRLYRTFFIRMKEDTYLGVQIEGVNSINDKGLFQLGGERKSAVFERLDRDPLEELKNLELNLSNGLFKLYFATPVIFENGWLPSWINQDSLEGEFNGVKVKLIACAIGKYQLVGGWDLDKMAQKPLKKTVPAGSVYYFQILDGDVNKVKEVFHLKNISSPQASKEGFGLALVGEVKIN